MRRPAPCSRGRLLISRRRREQAEAAAPRRSMRGSGRRRFRFQWVAIAPLRVALGGGRQLMCSRSRRISSLLLELPLPVAGRPLPAAGHGFFSRARSLPVAVGWPHGDRSPGHLSCGQGRCRRGISRHATLVGGSVLRSRGYINAGAGGSCFLARRLPSAMLSRRPCAYLPASHFSRISRNEG